MSYVRLKGVNRVRAKGRVYYYHRKTGERLPDDPRERETRLLAIEAEARKPQVQQSGTMGELIALYKASPEFLGKADSTRKDYRRYLDLLEQAAGQKLVRELDREAVLDIRDAYADRPRKAHFVVQVLSILCAFALERPKAFGLQANPCMKIKKLAKPDPYKPWPQDLIEAFAARAYDELRWIAACAFFTGQRAGDCRAMTWNHYRQGWLSVVQQKTSTRLEIPAHPAFADMLEREVRRRGVVIFTTRTGKAWTAAHLTHEIARIVRECGHDGYSLHGLRKNATNMLIEAGCSTKEVQAITGHATLAMVEHYGRDASQKRLAGSAMVKLKRAAKKNKAGPSFAKPADRDCKTGSREGRK